MAGVDPLSGAPTLTPFRFAAEVTTALAQITVVDARHGDCNVIDFCLAPATDNKDAPDRSLWQRSIIDTGPVDKEKTGSITKTLQLLAARLALPMLSKQKSSLTPKVKWLQITHPDDDHIGNAASFLTAMCSATTIGSVPTQPIRFIDLIRGCSVVFCKLLEALPTTKFVTITAGAPKAVPARDFKDNQMPLNEVELTALMDQDWVDAMADAGFTPSVTLWPTDDKGVYDKTAKNFPRDHYQWAVNTNKATCTLTYADTVLKAWPALYVTAKFRISYVAGSKRAAAQSTKGKQKSIFETSKGSKAQLQVEPVVLEKLMKTELVRPQSWTDNDDGHLTKKPKKDVSKGGSSGDGGGSSSSSGGGSGGSSGGSGGGSSSSSNGGGGGGGGGSGQVQRGLMSNMVLRPAALHFEAQRTPRSMTQLQSLTRTVDTLNTQAFPRNSEDSTGTGQITPGLKATAPKLGYVSWLGKTLDPEKKYGYWHFLGPNPELYSQMSRKVLLEQYKNIAETGGNLNMKDIQLDGEVINRTSIITMFERPVDDEIATNLVPFSMLFTGDAYDRACDIRDTLISWQPGLRLKDGDRSTPTGIVNVDLLKIPHHGSNKSTSSGFYAFVRANTYLVCGSHHDATGNPKLSSLQAIVKGFYKKKPVNAALDEPFRLFFSSPRIDEPSAVQPKPPVLSLKTSPYKPTDKNGDYFYKMYKVSAQNINTDIFAPFGTILLGKNAAGQVIVTWDKNRWEEL